MSAENLSFDLPSYREGRGQRLCKLAVIQHSCSGTLQQSGCKGLNYRFGGWVSEMTLPPKHAFAFLESGCVHHIHGHYAAPRLICDCILFVCLYVDD